MMKYQLPSVVITVLVFLFVSNTACGLDGTDTLVGNRAPLISGKKAVGSGLIKLSQLMTELNYKRGADGQFVEVNGKYVLEVTKNVVILNFFSTSCIPCIREIPVYNKLAEKYKDKPVRLIYVNIDAQMSSLEISRFIARKQIKVPMMMPNQREAIRKYKAYALPWMVIINKEGVVHQIIKGFNEDLETELSATLDHLTADIQ